MRVPLAVTPADDKLLVYRNGDSDVVEIPFKPFVLMEADKFPEIESPIHSFTKVPEYVVKNYKKLEFYSVRDLMSFKDTYADRSQYFIANGVAEQLYISYPDFLLDYPHTNDITVMFFDIEVASKGDGLFPKALTNEILCIGYSIWKYKTDSSIVKQKMDIIKNFSVENMDDGPLIQSFLDTVQSEDPDIIAGYNSTSFDLPYIIERAELKGIDITKLGRTQNAPRITEDQVIIPGRIHFDIYSSNSGVLKDQTLFGMKNRTLKELARFYKAKDDNGNVIQDVEIPEHIENLLKLLQDDPDLLYSYLRDDIFRTECVGQVYMRNCITLAERMHVPLQSIVLMYSSFVPKIMVARHFETLGLINTETNFSKYNFQNGSVARTGLKYEGALVGLYQDGLFDTSYKIDFSSMYPSSIQTFNLGPDTTSLVRAIRGPDKTYPGDEGWTGKFEARQDSKYNWYRIPTSFDKKARQYDLIVKVRNDKEGFLKQEIARLREERVKIKAELKQARAAKDDGLHAALNSQQYAIKVILNSIYGFLGLKTSKYGEMISAAMVTGTCRWTTGKVIRRFRKELIELDTDGLILDVRPDEEEVNKWLTDIIKERFGITDNYMAMEVEEFGRSFFYAMKNYVVQDGDKLSIHGSSLKASRFSHVEDRARDLAIQHIFNNKPKEEVIKEAYDFDNCTIEDFTRRVNLRKEIIEYDDQTCYQVFLAKQVEYKKKQKLTEGESISYVITAERLPQKVFKPFYKDGAHYTYVDYVKSVDEIDLNYYRELVDKKLSMFNIAKVEQTSLFGDTQKRYAKKLNVVPDDDI